MLQNDPSYAKTQNAVMMMLKYCYTTVMKLCAAAFETKQNGGGRSCSRFDKREHALISCAGCDPALPCTVPQGYCRALTILFPIFTSSVLPTTANGKWL